MTDRELTNEMIKRADEFVEKQKREFAIAELEKIKADIEEHNRKYLSDDNAGLERAIWDFIEPRISELKGE